MITHVVLFKMKEPAEEHATAVAVRLRAMEGKAKGLAAITVGEDVNRGPRAYDLCLITKHEDRDALVAYQVDPTHRAVKAYIDEVAEGSVVVDYEG
ncbi:MAG: Dabb family protein [Deltaproteobacteria bacterium]|nr:Dabb family protein [Deltaproteobacteria bacterium]